MGKTGKSGIFSKPIPTVCLSFVLLLTILGIAGWLFDRPIFASFNTHYIPMAPGTALMLLLLCGALLVHRDKKSGTAGKTIALVASIAVIVNCALVIDHHEGFVQQGKSRSFTRPRDINQMNAMLRTVYPRNSCMQIGFMLEKIEVTPCFGHRIVGCTLVIAGKTRKTTPGLEPKLYIKPMFCWFELYVLNNPGFR